MAEAWPLRGSASAAVTCHVAEAWPLRGSACVVARVERYGLAELGVAVEVEGGGLHPCVVRVTRVVDVPVLSHYES